MSLPLIVASVQILLDEILFVCFLGYSLANVLACSIPADQCADIIKGTQD